MIAKPTDPGVKHKMESKSVPEELQALRREIDAIDEELVAILARRFRTTREVGRIKAENGLDSVDPEREENKLKKLEQLARVESLDNAFVLALFQMIFREVVKNHRRMQQDAKAGDK